MRGLVRAAGTIVLTVTIATCLASAAEPVGAGGAPDPRAALAGAAGAIAPASAPVAPKVPLAEKLSPWLAVIVGAVGSAAYLVALWVGLVGTAEGKEQVLAHFEQLWWLKIPLFVSGGGAVAMVFQLPEGKLIPVQAFIIGCTWPAVVSNYLSGRQSGEGEAQARDVIKRQQDAKQLLAVTQEFPKPTESHSSAQAELDRLIAVVSEATPAAAGSGGAPPAQLPPDAIGEVNKRQT